VDANIFYFSLADLPRFHKATKGSNKAKFNSYQGGQARVKIETRLWNVEAQVFFQSLRNHPVLIIQELDHLQGPRVGSGACVWFFKNFLREGIEDDIKDDAIGAVPDDVPKVGDRDNERGKQAKKNEVDELVLAIIAVNLWHKR
jgi:hypothetical protein